MFTRFTHRTLAAAALLQLCAPAWADDQSAGVAPGRFHTKPLGGATLSAIRVTLDGDKARVALTATSRGAAVFELELPAFGWMGEAETYPDRQFPELAVDMDGRYISPADDFIATFSGKDITGQLRAAGVDPFVIADTPPFVQAQRDRRAGFDVLLGSGAVTTAPEGYLAGWKAKRFIRVSPGPGAHTLAFNYNARPAFALHAISSSIDIPWGSYCLTRIAAKRLLTRHGLHGPVIVKRYSFPATLNGNRPRLLTLRVTSPAGAQTVVCGADGAPLVNPLGEVPVRLGHDGAIHVLRVTAAAD